MNSAMGLQVEDVSHSCTMFTLIGPEAGKMLQEIAGVSLKLTPSRALALPQKALSLF